MVQFGKITGNIDLLDWDHAVVEGFGAHLDETKGQYFLPVNFYTEDSNERVDKVLVIFKRPEPTDADFVLPAIVVTRDNVVPGSARLHSPITQFRLPAPGARRVKAGHKLGWNNYITRQQEQPYDISYTIECWGRYRSEAQMLLETILVAYPLQTGRVTVTDSEDVERIYAVFQQNIADLTQVSSMVDRVAGFSISIKCEGELTLDRTSFTLPSFTGSLSSSPIPGINTNIGHDKDDSPNPGPGGLYGTGLPNTRVGLAEDI